MDCVTPKLQGSIALNFSVFIMPLVENGSIRGELLLHWPFPLV
jgi:hypothetical protein